MPPSTPRSRPRLRVARVLAVPALLAVVATAAAPGLLPGGTAGSHRVVRGDTLWDLAQRNGTTVAALKALNRLSSDTILVGQLLALPGSGAARGTATAPATGTPATTSYVVRLGDTLTGICARTGSDPAVVRRLNRLPADGTVLLGATLRLPAAPVSSVLTTGQGPLAPPDPAFRAAITRSEVRLAATRTVSRDQARALVRGEALRQGVDPSLALAVAYQESGFTHRVVSRTDAVGMMQLMPGTAAWVGPALLGRPIDRYDPRDNAAGGVALLGALLRAADTRTAVASYYQGLAQVRRFGMYADTRLYVDSVLSLRGRFS